MSDAAIWQEIGALKARLEALEKRPAASGSASGSSGGGAIASDYDLDSDWGNPTVAKDPKRWVDGGGDSFAGCKMSECPAEYLDAVANLYDWMADKDDEAGRKGETYFNKKQNKDVPKDGSFKRKDAARARGWAKRAREGHQAQPVAQTANATRQVNATQSKPVKDDYQANDFSSDDELPF
jgi:hypothetical protein